MLSILAPDLKSHEKLYSKKFRENVRFICLWFKTGMGLITLKFVTNKSVKN